MNKEDTDRENRVIELTDDQLDRASGGGDISLSFESVRFEYKPQSADGGPR
jgi:hypothetical protein